MEVLTIERRALVFYRAILGGQGAARKGEDGTVVRRGLSEKVQDRLTTPMTFTDTDGDGIADAWERTIFGNLSTATATSDFDKDGVTEKNDYITGTTPNDNAVYFKIVSSTCNGAFTQATVVFTTDATRLYRLETSNNLGVSPDVWTNSALGTFAPDAGPSTT